MFDVCRTNCAVFTRFCYSVFDISTPMSIGSGRGLLTILCSLKMNEADYMWRKQTIVCRPKAIWACNAWCRHTIMFRPSMNQAFHARKLLSDVYKSQTMREVQNKHRLSYVHRPRPIRAVHDQCQWLMSLSLSWCDFPKSHRPWLMVHGIAWYLYLQTDVHTQRLMREVLFLCSLSLADTSISWILT